MKRLDTKIALVGFVVTALSLPACSTQKKVNAVLDQTQTTLKSVDQLAKNFSAALNDLKAKANTPTTAAPIANASVPAIPVQATGGVDITKSQSGKTGSDQVDIEGSGEAQTVNVYQADSPSLAGTSASGLHIQTFTDDDATTFISWQGTADQGDEGQCYLGWEHDSKMWVLIAACGASTGHVCSDDGSNVSCSACDETGSCNACDENQPLSACTAAGGTPEDAGSSTDTDAGPSTDVDAG